VICPLFERRGQEINARLFTYSRVAVERAVKVQDMTLQAMAKKITWWRAAEILGTSAQHMQRWRERYEEEG